MKPAFALDFRDNAIALLHRTGNGWHQVGSVPIDEPDLPAALAYLRATALGLSPRGIATKLVIPNDQILYTTVSAPAADPAEKAAQIRAALAGRTPYEVDELVFDWSGRGDEVQVAVIARETLAEAEGFAAEHRFNPIGFVAAPAPGAFAGEPWFGPSSLAATLLPQGDSVERDAEPIAVTARVLPTPEPEPAPEPEPVPEPMAEPVAEVPVEAVTEPEPLPEPVAPEPAFVPEPPAMAPAPGPALSINPPVMAPPAPEPVEAVLPAEPPAPVLPAEPADLPDEDLAPQGFFTRQTTAPRPEPEPEELLAADPDLNPMAMFTAPAEVAAPEPAPEPAFDPAPAEPAEEAPMALDVDDEAEPPRPASSVTAPGIEDDTPPMPAWTPAMAFASRRAAETAGTAGKPSAAKAPAVERPAAARPLPSAPPRGDRPALGAAPKPPRPAVAPAPRDGKAGKGLGALVTAPGLAGKGKKKPTLPAAAAVAVGTEAAPTTARPAAAASPARPSAFGGLGGRPDPVRGKPRHLGLILVGLLLLFLAVVAAWSSITLSSMQGETPDAVQSAATDTSVAAPTDLAADQAGDIPDPADEMLADMQDPADFAETTAEPAPAEEVAAADLPAADAPATPAPQTSEMEAAPPPASGTQDEIFLATMDAPPAPADPLTLPSPEGRGDSLPTAQAAPPPFGTVYQFDDQGLIKPTPEGIVTPEGVTLIAGKPPRVPPARPEALTTAAAPATTETAAETPEATPAADPALAGFRPRARPVGLTPPAANPDDGTSLAPAADSRFASLRPRLRPESVLAAGQAARQASASASLAAQSEIAAQEASAGISPLAVAISRKPVSRPADLSRSVEAAVAEATRPAAKPEPEPEPVKTAAKSSSKATEPAHEADDEPEIASAAPSIPTKASVAKQATFSNAIDLGKTNLIGVYGTQSKRYALVRSSNGSYKKVRVGDRIDGGKVAAITDNELRYQKGSRLVVLKLPKG